MGKATGKLTVFFENPFWVGVFERWEDGKLSASKVVFGPEPKDGELYRFILERYFDLRFGPGVTAETDQTKKNPKRMQRQIKKQLSGGIGTKSQQALNLQREQNKQEHAAARREARKDEAIRRFELRQQKRKAKHKGK